MIGFQADKTAWEARRLRGQRVTVVYRTGENGTATVTGKITGWCLDYSGNPCMVIRSEIPGGGGFVPTAVQSMKILAMEEASD